MSMISFLKPMVRLFLALENWPKIILFNNILHKKVLPLLMVAYPDYKGPGYKLYVFIIRHHRDFAFPQTIKNEFVFHLLIMLQYDKVGLRFFWLKNNIK